MKKTTKICLIVALVLAIAGVGFCGASVALGLTWEKAYNEMISGKYSIGYEDFAFLRDHDDDDDGNDHIFGNQEEKSFELIDFEDIEVDMEAGGEFIIENVAKGEDVKVDTKGREVQVYVEDRTLHIKNESNFGIRNNAGRVVLYLPEGMSIGSLSVDLAAGRATIGSMVCNNYDIEVAAGQLNLSLEGVKEDYNYDIECAVGEIKIGDESFSGLASEKRINHDYAKGQVEVQCGAGQVNIGFEG